MRSRGWWSRCESDLIRIRNTLVSAILFARFSLGDVAIVLVWKWTNLYTVKVSKTKYQNSIKKKCIIPPSLNLKTCNLSFINSSFFLSPKSLNPVFTFLVSICCNLEEWLIDYLYIVVDFVPLCGADSLSSQKTSALVLQWFCHCTVVMYW